MNELAIWPSFGCRVRGNKIGYSKNIYLNFVRCPDCGKEFWSTQPKRILFVKCRSCCQPKGENHYNWNGGRYVDEWGYVHICIQRTNLFYGMSHQGDILEHRYVMAQYLNRLLLPEEIVHHIDSVKDHNIVDNLQLVNSITHDTNALIRRVGELEKQVRLLTWLVKESRCLV